MFQYQRKSRCKSARADSRSGSVLLEFILAFPIILILSFAIIEFGFFALLQQSITSAAIEGSREAAKVGSTPASIAALIQEYVAVNSLTLNPVSPATPGSGDVLVVVQETGVVLPVTIGNSSIPCSPVGPPPELLAPPETKVTICLNLTDTDNEAPIPNLLSSFGFSLTGKQLEVSAMTGVE